MVVPASRDLIRRIVLDYGFWDGYLDRPWEDTDDDEDIDDDPPEVVTDLGLLTAGELSLEAHVLQNPNLMTLFLRQDGELLSELGYDDACAQFLPWTLRWAELEYIARLAATASTAQSSSAPRPTVPSSRRPAGGPAEQPTDRTAVDVGAKVFVGRVSIAVVSPAGAVRQQRCSLLESQLIFQFIRAQLRRVRSRIFQ